MGARERRVLCGWRYSPAGKALLRFLNREVTNGHRIMGGDVFTLRREVGRGDSGAGPLRSRRVKTRPSRELPRVVATPGVQRLLTFRPRVRAWPHTCPSGKTRSFSSVRSARQ